MMRTFRFRGTSFRSGRWSSAVGTLAGCALVVVACNVGGFTDDNVPEGDRCNPLASHDECGSGLVCTQATTPDGDRDRPCVGTDDPLLPRELLLLGRQQRQPQQLEPELPAGLQRRRRLDLHGRPGLRRLRFRHLHGERKRGVVRCGVGGGWWYRRRRHPTRATTSPGSNR